MIISDLSYLENVSEVSSIVGGCPRHPGGHGNSASNSNNTKQICNVNLGNGNNFNQAQLANICTQNNTTNQTSSVGGGYYY